MKNTFLLALVGISIFPLTSQASLQIRIDDGLHSLMVTDNTPLDTTPILGINTINQPLDNWVVNVVSSANLGSTITSPALNLTSFNFSYNGSSAPSAPLKIFLTDTGYGPTPGVFDLYIGGTQSMSASITSRSFYDTANTAFGTTTPTSHQIGSTQTFSSASYSNNQLAAGPGGTIGNPYSLTIETDITNVPGGFFTAQFTNTLLTSVPLPPALAMFASGLLGLGALGRKKTQA
jgi:hypothetical protein